MTLFINIWLTGEKILDFYSGLLAYSSEVAYKL